MALYSTYENVGAKEDISAVISNISPTKTPFQSMIGNEKSTQKVFQWQEDSLRAVADNNQAEGFDPTDVTAVPTVMRSNIVQIMQETIKVSGSLDNTDNYGRAKETAYQLAKSSAQVKRDLENTYVGLAQAKVTPADNLTNRKMAGYQTQINTSGTSQVVYTGAGPAPLAESFVLSAMQNLYNQGADPTSLMVTPNNSTIVSDFAKATGRLRDITDGTTIVNTVEVYRTPFGKLSVSLNRFLKSINTLVFDPENWTKVTFRPWTRETLAKTGDSTKIMIVGEFSLKHKNFRASSVIVEGTTGF